MKIKNIFLGTLIIAIIAISLNSCKSKNYSLKTFKVENGWGYSIYKKDKIIIKQLSIPTIQVSKPFKTKDDAIKIGNLVVNKLENKKSPTISYQELLINKINL